MALVGKLNFLSPQMGFHFLKQNYSFSNVSIDLFRIANANAWQINNYRLSELRRQLFTFETINMYEDFDDDHKKMYYNIWQSVNGVARDTLTEYTFRTGVHVHDYKQYFEHTLELHMGHALVRCGYYAQFTKVKRKERTDLLNYRKALHQPISHYNLKGQEAQAKIAGDLREYEIADARESLGEARNVVTAAVLIKAYQSSVLNVMDSMSYEDS